MNGFILVVPILFIRYGILSILSVEAARRAAFFPPTEGNEKMAYWIYQVTTLCLLVILIFTKPKLLSKLNFIGLGTYLTGMILYIASVMNYAKPNQSGLSVNGLYRISRNPMYVAFFLYFLGCSLLTNSLLLLFTLIIFQISAHYLILSEERWCVKIFGAEYKNYMAKVRRYI